MDRETRWATVHGVTESDTTKAKSFFQPEECEMAFQFTFSWLLVGLSSFHMYCLFAFPPLSYLPQAFVQFLLGCYWFMEILLLCWSFVSYTKGQLSYPWMQRSLHFVDSTFPCTEDFHVNVIKLIFSLMICPFSSCLRNSYLSWENKYRLLHILH